MSQDKIIFIVAFTLVGCWILYKLGLYNPRRIIRDGMESDEKIFATPFYGTREQIALMQLTNALVVTTPDELFAAFDLFGGGGNEAKTQKLWDEAMKGCPHGKSLAFLIAPPAGKPFTPNLG